jgi:hypothetical protein
MAMAEKSDSARSAVITSPETAGGRFVWDKRTGRVLASVWGMEEEVTEAMRRLRSHFPVVAMTLVVWTVVAAFAYFTIGSNIPLWGLFVLLWFVASGWIASSEWERNIARAKRTWRGSFRSRVKEFGEETHLPVGSAGIKIVCARAYYTKLNADGSLTDEREEIPSWGYWVPGLGYLGWGHVSADDAQAGAIRRITEQLTVNREDNPPVPIAADITQQREIWLNVELVPQDQAIENATTPLAIPEPARPIEPIPPPPFEPRPGRSRLSGQVGLKPSNF